MSISRLILSFHQVMKYIKNEGFLVTLSRCRRTVKTAPILKAWMNTHNDNDNLQKVSGSVLFSIITPLYNTDAAFLKEMIESVLSQTYGNWELCLADGSDNEHDYVGSMCLEYAHKDQRIKYKKLDKNYGIVGNSNRCIEMSQGEYISLLDHDDILCPTALADTYKAVTSNEADFVYSDEMLFLSPDVKDVIAINFKSDYASDNLNAQNYICHFTSFRKSLLGGTDAFREGYEGSQDHDLFMRLTRVATRVVHIPKVLYYWRSHSQSTAQTIKSKPYASVSGVKAVQENLSGNGFSAEVVCHPKNPTIYKVQFSLCQPLPKVSVVLSSGNSDRCISSLRKTTYANYETVNALKDATGEYLLFLDSNSKVITPDWIEQMLMYAQRKDVGAVGGMILYPDNTVENAGMIIGMGNVPVQPVSRGLRRGDSGYMGRLFYAQNMSAVSGACLMVRKDVFESIGGYDEEMPHEYKGIDLCLRLRQQGYLIVWTPWAEVYHYVSGKDLEESRYFINKWKELIEKGDPYFNPNLVQGKYGFVPKL